MSAVLLRESDALAALGYTLLLSASNKRFLGELLGLDIDDRREVVARGGRVRRRARVPHRAGPRRRRDRSQVCRDDRRRSSTHATGRRLVSALYLVKAADPVLRVDAPRRRSSTSCSATRTARSSSRSSPSRPRRGARRADERRRPRRATTAARGADRRRGRERRAEPAVHDEQADRRGPRLRAAHRRRGRRRSSRVLGRPARHHRARVRRRRRARAEERSPTR